MIDFKKSVDNSRAEAYDTCPQLFDYLYNQELDPGESGIEARYGTHMIHRPIQEWYAQGGNFEPDWQYFFNEWAPSQEELLALKHNDYTCAVAEKIFKEYVERFSDDLERYEYVCAECYYEKEVAEGLPKWGSKLDMLLRDKETQEIVPFEFKSSRWEYILTGLNFNRQVLGQIYTTESKKCVVNYFGLNGYQYKKNDLRVSRFEIEPLPEEMERWRRDRAFELGVMGCSAEHGVWPMKSKSCKRFNRDCAFLDLCNGGSSKDWPKKNPLAYLEE